MWATAVHLAGTLYVNVSTGAAIVTNLSAQAAHRTGRWRRARRVTDGMLLAAARAVAGIFDISAPGAPLLPGVADLRRTSVAVAAAVARAAEAEGVASATVDADLTGQVSSLMWEPRYRPVSAALHSTVR